MAKKTLTEQAQEIIKIAEESGVQSNFFFITTFKRYQVQLNILSELEKTIKEEYENAENEPDYRHFLKGKFEFLHK